MLWDPNAISRQEDAPYINMGTGEHIYPMTANKKSGLTRFSDAYVEIEPGKSTTMHHHPKPYEKLYHIIEGIGQMILGGSIYAVKAGDVIPIKPNAKHKLINIGTGTLKFIVICSPPWNPDCIITDE